MKNLFQIYVVFICKFILTPLTIFIFLSGCVTQAKNISSQKSISGQYCSEKNIVIIPSGNYQTPYIAATPDTEYVLEGDIVADGTAIVIKASKIIINLNGKTITYNQKIPGEGVAVGEWNKTEISIVNGTIIQGTAMSEGDQYGVGNNPVRTTPFYVNKLHVGNIYAKYGGRDVGGIIASSDNSVFEENVLEDHWEFGTMKNRHQGIDALAGSKHNATKTNNIYRNNTIINARHRGINTGKNSIVYGNRVTINSLATNSTGIAPGSGSKVYSNTIIGRGEHPIGIFYVSKEGEVEIHNNTIDVQTTRLGTEYGGNPACLNPNTPCGNYAVGFRTTWGGDNINFHDNTIVVRTDSAYNGTHSVTGKPVVIHAKGRGLMVAVNAGEKAKFYNNTITVLDKDGSGKAFGVACTGNNAGEMVFEGNRVTSNILNVALGDEYGACGGYPLFVRNTFVKSDNYPGYKTVASELAGYFEGTGRFVSNSYEAGASQSSVALNAGNKSNKSVGFGREISVELLKSDGKPDIGATLKIENGSPLFDVTAITDADGKATLVVYDYELHNRASKTEQRRVLAPHTIRVVSGADQLVTRPDSQAEAWDALMATGNHELPLYTEASGVRAGILKIFYNTGKVLR